MHKICDIHAHIVPNIDDGAKDFDMSLDLLRMAYNQGTRHIICSSHSWGYMSDYENYFKKLCDLASNENININLYSGCEIDCNVNSVESIINALNNGKLCTVNRTNYILVEFHPYSSKLEFINYITRFVENGYIPIIAHVERYVELYNSYDFLISLKDFGCLFQINAYSLRDESNDDIKHCARKLIADRHVSFIGSDVHRTNHRSYRIENGIEYIYEHCDIEYANDICYKNAEHILNMKETA